MADKLVRVMVSVETANAMRSMGQLGAASDELAVSGGASMDKMVAGSGGALTKLGEKLGSWGVPFSSSLTGVGQKFDAAGSKGAKTGAIMPLAGRPLAAPDRNYTADQVSTLGYPFYGLAATGSRIAHFEE
jgi:hypothetical protein